MQAAKKASADTRRKLIAFDSETWHALDLLARDSMKSWQELADEAFRDLLGKHGRPTDLRAALKQSMKSAPTQSAPTKSAPMKSAPAKKE
jgi:hypothetical protein